MATKHPGGPAPSRREALILGAAATLAATGLGTKGVAFAAAVPVSRTPGETEGPYWVDGQPNRSDLRTDTATGAVATGFPLILGINVSTLVNGAVKPVAGAKVDIWHASAGGVYSAVAAQNTAANNFLRGYQVTNSRGSVGFTTVYAGWYSGRTPHIHFRVRTYTAAGAVSYNFVSQLFFDDDITDYVYTLNPYRSRPNRDTDNDTDSIYGGASLGNGATVADEVGDYTLMRLATNKTYAVASFNVVL